MSNADYVHLKFRNQKITEQSIRKSGYRICKITMALLRLSAGAILSPDENRLCQDVIRRGKNQSNLKIIPRLILELEKRLRVFSKKTGLSYLRVSAGTILVTDDMNLDDVGRRQSMNAIKGNGIKGYHKNTNSSQLIVRVQVHTQCDICCKKGLLNFRLPWI